MIHHKAVVTPRIDDSKYCSQMQVSCKPCRWESNKVSYAEQVADYQEHKNK